MSSRGKLRIVLGILILRRRSTRGPLTKRRLRASQNISKRNSNRWISSPKNSASSSSSIIHACYRIDGNRLSSIRRQYEQHCARIRNYLRALNIVSRAGRGEGRNELFYCFFIYAVSWPLFIQYYSRRLSLFTIFSFFYPFLLEWTSLIDRIEGILSLPVNFGNLKA